MRIAIRGGTVYDGTGAPGRTCDVLVDDGRVAVVGDVDGVDAEEIDAAGLEPGVERDEYDKISRVFISAHSGAGLDLLRSAIAETAKSGPGQSYRVTPENEEQDDAFELAEVDASVDALPGGLAESPADHLPTSTLVGPR